ncbi:MAG: enoyl-CoA hydratase/isomerase family protein [Burkholderiales bacterium]|nr:enoyl-CoA hydratase/isomerase family protein [Burkholderiales bacterium]
MAGTVSILRRGAIAEMRFDNPAKFNAMSLAMWQDVAAHAKALAPQDDVRVLLLRGEGEKAFISGADISEFDSNRSAETGSAAYDNAVQDAQDALVACPFPVVAAIHGVCMGGGLGLAVACDLRYGAAEARFRMPAARLGLGYSFGGIERMVHVLGAARVADLFFTARTFDGIEAQRLGLLHTAWPAAQLDKQVEQVLEQIANNAPLSVRLAKKAIGLALRRAPETANAEIELGRGVCLHSADYAEGRRAFAEKRVPAFTGR